MIRFNEPFITGNELKYIEDVLKSKHLSGDGKYTNLCKRIFLEKYSFRNNFLTTSGTDALEMAAILTDIKEGDEVIMPSYTFVSTANAFALRGARVVFVDSMPNHPNMDVDKIESLITKNTKAIVPIHYGGVSCKMDEILEISKNRNISVIEDAAHSIDAFYKGKPLGGVGDFGAFSFHETKNITSGEGGLLVVKDDIISKRAEIVREKGTNRSEFFRGEVDKYGWVDIGSSFLPSEILASFLFAQLEQLEKIQENRLGIWKRYYTELKPLTSKGFFLPEIPDYATNNAHLFYLITPSLELRNKLIDYMNTHNVKCVFHYQALHKSKYYLSKNKETELVNAENFSDTLVRLPLFAGLSYNQQSKVIEKMLDFSKII